MDIKEKKKALRNEIWSAEKLLDRAYKDDASASICANIMGLPEYKAAGTVLAFVSMKREVDLSALLADVLGSGKTLCVPLCKGKGLMDFRRISGKEDLEPGFYGLMEPKKDCPVIPPEDIEFAVIPCVSCDREGRRLGNGGGYYDRFLERHRPPMAMVCREKLMSKEIPVEPFDVAVPVIVTEDGVFRKR